jgi:hypothetical protein
MALTVSLNGTNYSVPEPGESGYDLALTQYLKALATAFPQLGVAAAQPLTQELDLGPTFGVKAAWFKGQTANPAQAGQVRLAKTDTVRWRNNANSADLSLTIDAADALTFAGANVTGNPMLDVSTSASPAIANSLSSIVVFGTVTRDSDNAYAVGTGRYTVPAGKGGDYLISAGVRWNANPGASALLSIFVGGAAVRQAAGVGVAGGSQSQVVSAVVNLAAAAIVDIRVFQASGGAVALSATGAENYFNLKRIPT